MLCALPALLANGLFHDPEKRLDIPKGYYSLSSLMITFAFLSLARVKHLEGVRYLAPGEWGRMLGLDRIPEVKTLRQKLDHLSSRQFASQWMRDMSKYWMRLDEELAGVLYVDGHVNSYSGSQSVLPARFSSRNRLCVRSLMDYWVNDKEGPPFFVVTAVGTEGIIHHLMETIVPRLLQDVPRQPSEEELATDLKLHRFVIVFDREGWSPALFAQLWRQYRIGVITYQKGAKKETKWADADFEEQEVDLVYQNKSKMLLAEKSFTHKDLSATDTQPEVAAREIRKSCDNSHQTSIITTVLIWDQSRCAGQMFARWSQENFFKYGSDEFAIDSLSGHETSHAPQDETVMNPPYRDLTAKINKNRSQITKIRTTLGHLILPSNEDQEVAEFIIKQSGFLTEKNALEEERKQLLLKRKELPSRIPLSCLPPNQRPKLVSAQRNFFLNTIRIIAYRAETALVNVLRKNLMHQDEARRILKTLFTHDADLLVDDKEKTLTVRLHHFSSRQISLAVEKILDELNKTETIFPDTNLRLIYEMVSSSNPRSQDV